jgi:hypothetical protein
LYNLCSSHLPDFILTRHITGLPAYKIAIWSQFKQFCIGVIGVSIKCSYKEGISGAIKQDGWFCKENMSLICRIKKLTKKFQSAKSLRVPERPRFLAFYRDFKLC